MGRYIDEILQPGERVLYSTNEHWVYFLPAIAAWIGAIAFLVLWRLVTGDVLMLVCVVLAAVAGLAALYWTATAWFHRWTTETDVTNMRVVHKTGFIKRRTFEMSLDKVESVDVNQSILGRLMDYGDLTIQGVGEGTQTISTITSPPRVSQRHHGKTAWRVNLPSAITSRPLLSRSATLVEGISPAASRSTGSNAASAQIRRIYRSNAPVARRSAWPTFTSPNF